MSLYQKEEDMVFSPIVNDGTFISQHNSLLPLNLLDCGLVVFLLLFKNKAPQILPSFYQDWSSVYEATQLHMRSIYLSFYAQKVRRHQQMISLWCCVVCPFFSVLYWSQYNILSSLSLKENVESASVV